MTPEPEIKDWREKFETFKIFLDWFASHVVEPLQQSNEAKDKQIEHLKALAHEFVDENASLKAENERLIGLLEGLYVDGLTAALKAYRMSDEFINDEIKTGWQQFKQLNNLP